MFTVDFIDGTAIEWKHGGEPSTNRDWAPAWYLGPGRNDDLEPARSWLQEQDHVASIQTEQWKPKWRDPPTEVLAVQMDRHDRIQPLARSVRQHLGPRAYRCYNVDLSPKFRYCLETNTQPQADELTTLEISISEKQAMDDSITPLTIGETTLTGSPETIITALDQRLDEIDPDVLVLSHATIIPRLYQAAADYGIDSFTLGRMPGWEQLAGASSYEQYGNIGHSPARYNVPGRAVLNRSNSFFLSETNMQGLSYLVEQSWKPIQEAGWASIGNVLTAMQIKKAYRNQVLIPWKAWRPEMPKTMETLHTSDRGGFIFSPQVGVHRDVHEADFASLYPNIIRTRRISPDVIRCDCHPHRDDVPELGYSICPDGDAYLQDVLGTLIDDRERLKKQLRNDDLDDATRKRLEGMTDSIKWILVSCFGYQGFSNAKFGRIECHEAINAVARDILLEAKTIFEDAGYQIIHGIIDSIWVQEQEDTLPIKPICERISDETDITLDYEGHYDWIAFCPRRDQQRGALNRYFGKQDDGSFKIRGIECRQSSTPPFISSAQHQMLEALDRSLDPEDCIAVLKRQIRRLENHDADTEQLAITRSVTRHPDEYRQQIKAASAVRRANEQFDHTIMPGQSVSYIVTDDDKEGQERIRLPYENNETYDTAFYREQLIRAGTSLLSPFGWTKTDVDHAIQESRPTRLSAFSDAAR